MESQHPPEGRAVAVQTIQHDIQPLHYTFSAARRRLWWQKGLLTFTRSLCFGLFLVLVGGLLAGWQAPQTAFLGFWGAAALAPLAGLIAAFVLRPSVSQAARIADLRLGLHQQLGTAEELLTKGPTEGLASTQIARASVLASQTSIYRAFPLLPKREVAVAFALAAATTIVLVLVSLGVTLPNPLTAIRIPSFSSEAAAGAEMDPFANQLQNNGLRSPSPALDSVRQTLDALQKQSLRGALSPAAAAAALAQASSELNRIANESRIHQQALEKLAKELKNTAAGREAAESLRQGNYERAAEQLREIGHQSDQLSEAAKKELAQALNRAAAQSQLDQGLSRAESNAAQALQRDDYSSTVQSMDELARAMQNSANRMVPQQELAESWQQLEELNKQLGNLNPQGNHLGPLSPPVAQAPQGATERRTNGPGQGDREPGSAEPSGQAEGEAQGGMSNNGGQPGNSRGGPPLGNPNQRLGAEGSPLDVEGKIGDRFPGEPSSDSRAPSVVREGKGNSIPSAGGGGADGPISVPAEKVLVPGDRRSIIRDYFNGGSGDR